MDADFCARVSCTKWKAVRKFFRSGLAEKIIEFAAPATSVAQCRQMGLDMAPLKLRLISIEKDDKVAVLITSLIDIKKYPINIFNDLYHLKQQMHDESKKIFFWLRGNANAELALNGQKSKIVTVLIPYVFFNQKRFGRAFYFFHDRTIVDYDSHNHKLFNVMHVSFYFLRLFEKAWKTILLLCIAPSSSGSDGRVKVKNA